MVSQASSVIENELRILHSDQFISFKKHVIR